MSAPAPRNAMERLRDKLREIGHLSGWHARDSEAHRATVEKLRAVEEDIRTGFPLSATCRLSALRDAMEALDVFVARRDGRGLLLEALVLADEADLELGHTRIPPMPPILAAHAAPLLRVIPGGLR